MDIFGAARGHYSAIKDEAAFDINICVTNQSDKDALKNMISAIRRFNEANQCMNLLTSLEDHYKSGVEEKENED